MRLTDLHLSCGTRYKNKRYRAYYLAKFQAPDWFCKTSLQWLLEANVN